MASTSLQHKDTHSRSKRHHPRISNANAQGSTAENPILVEEASQSYLSITSREPAIKPSALLRPAAERNLPLIIDPAVSAQDTFLHTLKHDRALMTCFISLLAHLKTPDPAELRVRGSLIPKKQRLDSSGKPVSEEEWRLVHTQELLAGFTLALQKAIDKGSQVVAWKAARIEGRPVRSGDLCSPVPVRDPIQIEASIREWLLEQSAVQITEALPSMTPSSSRTSSLALPNTPLTEPVDLVCHYGPMALDQLSSRRSDFPDPTVAQSSWDDFTQLFASSDPSTFPTSLDSLPSDGLPNFDLLSDLFGFGVSNWQSDTNASLGQNPSFPSTFHYPSHAPEPINTSFSQPHYSQSTAPDVNFFDIDELLGLTSTMGSSSQPPMEGLVPPPVFDPALVPPPPPFTFLSFMGGDLGPSVSSEGGLASHPPLSASSLSETLDGATQATSANSNCAVNDPQSPFPSAAPLTAVTEIQVEPPSQTHDISLETQDHEPNATSSLPSGSTTEMDTTVATDNVQQNCLPERSPHPEQTKVQLMSALSRAEELRTSLRDALERANRQLWELQIEEAVLGGVAKAITRRVVEDQVARSGNDVNHDGMDIDTNLF